MTWIGSLIGVGSSLNPKTVGSVVAPLVNGTPTLYTYLVPNDGLYHTIVVTFSKFVAVAETGGQIVVTFNDAATGTNTVTQLYAGGSSTIGIQPSLAPFAQVLSPGSSVVIRQSTALTAGSSTVAVQLSTI